MKEASTHGYRQSIIFVTAMESQTILFIIIAISVLGYVADLLLDYINLRHQKTEIPQEVSAFYDRDRYLKSLDYHRDLTMFSFLTSTVSIIISISLLWYGVFGWLDDQIGSVIHNEILRALAFFGIVMLASDILTLPFQLYRVFVLEERYGFNKMTLRTFVLDKIKGYVLGALIGSLLVSALIYFINLTGQNFWILFGFVASVFILFVNMFYTSWILPLFNKLTPLEDGELKNAINAFAAKVNFPLDSIYVIDGSKRSSKANAFFSGIGKRKKIVLYDTLISNHTTAELVAVLAHEVGHFKKKHIIFSLFSSVIQIFFMLFVLSSMVLSPEVSFAMGASAHSVPLNLLAFGILFSPVSAVVGTIGNIFSRKHEFEADAYAAHHYSGRALAEALKKLSVDSLSNLFPHPLYVFFHYSHPPLLRRLAAIGKESM